MSAPFDGRGVVVTGAAAGIGRACAELFAARGARLALVDRDAVALAEAADALRAGGVEVHAVPGTIGLCDETRTAFDAAAAALGRVHVLVNNAGIYLRTAIEDIDDEEWDRTFDVNVRGLFHMSVAAVQHMRGRGGGRIVNIASVDGIVPFPGMAHYAASKAAVISLTKTFGLAYAREGVRINAVAPGAVDTPPMHLGGHLERLEPTIPLARAAEPREIAEAVAFLAGDAASYCIGETLVASGGLAFR